MGNESEGLAGVEGGGQWGRLAIGSEYFLNIKLLFLHLLVFKEIAWRWKLALARWFGEDGLRSSFIPRILGIIGVHRVVFILVVWNMIKIITGGNLVSCRIVSWGEDYIRISLFIVIRWESDGLVWAFAVLVFRIIISEYFKVRGYSGFDIRAILLRYALMGKDAHIDRGRWHISTSMHHREHVGLSWLAGTQGGFEFSDMSVQIWPHAVPKFGSSNSLVWLTIILVASMIFLLGLGIPRASLLKASLIYVCRYALIRTSRGLVAHPLKIINWLYLIPWVGGKYTFHWPSSKFSLSD